MIEWKERIMVPIPGTDKIVDGYDNPCEECEDWGEPCEFCDVCVPITCEFEPKEITVRQLTLCGIPVGHPQYIFEE